MKSIITFTMLLLLVACASYTNSPELSIAPQAVPASIQAFIDVCLRNAPSFQNSSQAASSFGVEEFEDYGFLKIGSNQDGSISVQIKEDKECTITTPKQSTRHLTQLFLNEIGQQSGVSIGVEVPVKSKVGVDTFIFMHDREGGEAFVMLKATS